MCLLSMSSVGGLTCHVAVLALLLLLDMSVSKVWQLMILAIDTSNLALTSINSS